MIDRASSGWLPDPTGRFARRYFDGERWTDTVANEPGAPLHDPMETEPIAPPLAEDSPQPTTADRKRPRTRSLIVAGLVVACLTGGGLWYLRDDGTSASGPAVADAEELAALLQGEGLGCDPFEPADPDDPELVQSQSSGSCELDGGGSVEILVYLDEGVRQNAESSVQTLGCAFGSAFGVATYSYVAGPNWLIGSEDGSTTVTEQVGDATGGEPHTINCED